MFAKMLQLWSGRISEVEREDVILFAINGILAKLDVQREQPV